MAVTADWRDVTAKPEWEVFCLVKPTSPHVPPITLDKQAEAGLRKQTCTH